MLVTRMLLSVRDKNETWRIVHVEPQVAWIRRRDTREWPFPLASDEILGMMSDGRLRLPQQPARITSAPSVKSGALQEKRAEILRPLISTDIAPLLVDTDERNRLIAERLTELEGRGNRTSYQNVCNLLFLWWDGGMTYHALAPAYANCGAPGKPRQNAGPKVGRPRWMSPGIGINADADVRRMMERAAELYLMDREATVRSALDWLVMTYFSDIVTDDAGRGKVVVREERPTLRQLQFHILTRFPRHVRRRLKFGERNYQLSKRELTSRADHDVQAPGDRYEIDATIADAYLVSVHDRTVIIGRPVVYSVIDSYSHAVAGIYVGLEGPSWVGAMMALVNMVTPKVAFCAEYGIPITDDEWPCHHAPKTIMADRGELLSHELGKNIVENLQIDIQNTAPYRGDMKAIVERSHQTITRTWSPYVPGHVLKDFGMRGAPDYRLKAALNIIEFTRMVIRSVLIANNEPNPKRDVVPGMVEEGLSPSPLEFWDYGVRNLAPRLHHLTVDEVALEVMPTARAQVTSRGIEFMGKCYDGDLARREDWYARARDDRNWYVDVSFDPRRPKILYLRSGLARDVVERLHPMEFHEDRCEVSLWDEASLIARNSRNIKAAATNRTSRRLTHIREMDSIREGAEEASKAALAASPAPNAARVRGIRDNRADERAVRAEAEALVIGPPEPDEGRQPAPVKPTSRLERLRKIVHEEDPT